MPEPHFKVGTNVYNFKYEICIILKKQRDKIVYVHIIY